MAHQLVEPKSVSSNIETIALHVGGHDGVGRRADDVLRKEKTWAAWSIHTHTHTHTHIYIYIYIYTYIHIQM